MPKVSVIIPVYKVEQYLQTCLDSVSRQTFQDFELILVDDGSPDRCGEMCDAYAATHPNTKVVHQENKGLSEARNEGVKVSSGEYITFIDSDDLVAPDYIEYLLDLAEKHEVEVSIAKSVLFWEDRIPEVEESGVTDCRISAEEALIRICYNKIGICAWGKLYKRHLVEKHPYPAGQLFEDTATTHKIVGDTDAVAHGSHVIYYWRQRSGSITHSTITQRHLYGITASKEQMEYMKERYPRAYPAALARCVMKIVALSYGLVMGEMDRTLFRCVRAEVKPLLASLLKDKKAGLSLKIRAVTLRLGYVPYCILSKLYSLVKRT